MPTFFAPPDSNSKKFYTLHTFYRLNRFSMESTYQSTNVIRTEGLTKHFGDVTAVDGLNLEIHKGEIFGFLGPNGAGKSTSINMLCGLIHPDAGQIFINGKPAGHDGKLRISFGLCPQDIVIWPRLTCIEQLVFIGEMYGMSALSARRSGLNLLDQLGLNTKTNKLAGTLSGGMKRRLNLCLALVHGPEVVVLDEPEAGLDPQSRVMVRSFVRSLKLNKTVILTTHNMDEADRLSDRVAIIDNGRLLLTDTPENLKSSVGEGNVLEIHLHVKPGKTAKEALDLLNNIAGDAREAGEVLLVRVKKAAEQIPFLTASLQEKGFNIDEIKMRANTLEDVFIQLTGKRLRE
jgi:ABC-2 type transport system ATP-binding protein